MDTLTVCSPGFRCDGGASGAGGGGAQGGDQGAVQYGGDDATEYFGFGGYPGSNSTAELPGSPRAYDYYEWVSDNGSITISYEDGAPGAPLNLAGTVRDRCRCTDLDRAECQRLIADHRLRDRVRQRSGGSVHDVR